MKIKKITIENFRGIRLPLVLDFVKGRAITSALVYGRNGTGKSSIVDAWEWFNYFNIASLSREGVYLADIPHKASGGKKSFISVDFQHSSIDTIKVEFDNNKITTPKVTGDYKQFKSLSTYPNYLRYSDLQDFVYKTKAERYKYIAKYFGLEKFTLLQDTLSNAINKLTSNLSNHQKYLDKNILSINNITKDSKVDDTIILNFINSIVINHKIPRANKFADAILVKAELEKIVSRNPVAKELSEWKSFQAKLGKFYPITSLSSNISILEKQFAELKKDEETIKQLILSSLYEKSIEIIPKLEDETVCPVCDTKFTGDLLKYVKEKNESLNSLNKLKIDYEKSKNTLLNQLSILASKIAIVQSESSSVILEKFNTFYQDVAKIKEAIPDIVVLLKKQLKDIPELKISSESGLKVIDNLIVNLEVNKKIVLDKINALSKDKSNETLAQDFTNISNIIDNYRDFQINQAKVNYLKAISDNLQLLFSLLTLYVQNTIKATFTTLSSDVVDYFNILESSNRFIRNPELKLITGKDKAIELEIEFVSEKISPAFKILSESQVNSFGLAIFLAAVKHFNTEFKFFILDDVVNSFDSFKRPKISQLIATKFSDYQVIILTHDQVFFETVQRDFPNWQRYKFTSWDYTTGPKMKLSKNYAEEIGEYLKDDDPIAAGQRLGRYLEWTFGVLNENMQTPVKYKSENIYTLSEFYDPLIKRFKDKLKQPNKKHKLNILFDNFEQGTIFRNYCAHWKSEASTFTTPEIADIFNKWSEIEETLYCKLCKSFAKFDSSTGSEYVKCNCGKLDLKEDCYFS